MNFTNIISLSFTQNPDFLGQETHPHRIHKTVIIKTLPNGAVNGTNIPILLNGNSIGTGDISVQLEKDVNNFEGQQFQIATINLYEDGFASYLGLGSLADINTLDESFQTNYNEDSSITTTHTVNITPRDNQKLLALAKTIANTLRKNYGTRKTIFQESFNLVIGTYSFTENSTTLSSGADYFSKINHTYTLEENGNVNITEQGEIKAISQPIITSAENGLQTELAAAYTRCLTFFNQTSDQYSLNAQFINRQIIRNKFTGVYTYSINFTNDPRILTDYSWEYNITVETNDEDISTVKEEGTIKGYGCTRKEKYGNAIAGYNFIKGGIFNRVLNYINNLISEPVIISVSKSEFQGTVSYSQTYTNDPNYILDNLFIRQEISIDRKLPVRLLNRFLAYKLGEVIQDSGTSTIGQLTANINLIGRRGTGNINIYLDRAKSLLNITEGCYISNAQWSLNPSDFQFSFSITYNYFEEVQNIPGLPLRIQ